MVPLSITCIQTYHGRLFISGRKDLAIEMYKKGIDELEKGISVEITGQGKHFAGKIMLT